MIHPPYPLPYPGLGFRGSGSCFYALSWAGLRAAEFGSIPGSCAPFAVRLVVTWCCTWWTTWPDRSPCFVERLARRRRGSVAMSSCLDGVVVRYLPPW